MKYVSIALVLVACGDDPKPATTTEVADTSVTSTPETTTETVDTVTEVEVVEPVGCVPESAVAEGCRSVEWSSIAPYPRKSDHHTTLVHTTGSTTWLYVVGGITMTGQEAVFDEVRRAEIQPFGLIGAWEDEAPLAMPLGFHGQAVDGDRVWLTAGLSEDADGPFGVNGAWLGRFDAEGHLTFERTSDMPAEVRLHPTALFAHDRVVVVGGTNGQHPIDTVVVAEVSADGTLGTWRSGPTLPGPRSHHGAVVHDGRIYLFGGFDEANEPIADLWRSTHDAAGEPTGWEVIGTMSDPPWTHAATLYKDGVLLVGGGQGGPGHEQYIDRVRWARFLPDGTVSTFIDVVDPLPRARSHVHQAPIFDGFIYSVGGRSAPAYQSITDVFSGYLGF